MLVVILLEEGLHAITGKVSEVSSLVLSCLQLVIQQDDDLIILFQIVNALDVSAKRDAVLVQGDFAAGKPVEVVDTLSEKDVFNLPCACKYRCCVVSRHLAVRTLIPSTRFLLNICDHKVQLSLPKAIQQAINTLLLQVDLSWTVGGQRYAPAFATILLSCRFTLWV